MNPIVRSQKPVCGCDITLEYGVIGLGEQGVLLGSPNSGWLIALMWITATAAGLDEWMRI